ncbi:MAG: class I lanthipeptide [Phycisphaerae bacterium]|nr:class I lanthipeptide [Phycisphaerae bacterium]
MKKRTKKLVLNKETVRALQDIDLRSVAGGQGGVPANRGEVAPLALAELEDGDGMTRIVCPAETCLCPELKTRP